MAESGQTAVVHYTARLASGPDAGALVDTTDVDVALAEDAYDGTRDYEPLEFEVGAGETFDAVDDAMGEMESGDTRTLTLGPDDAFGPYSDERVVEVPREGLEERSGVEVTPGEIVVSDAGDSGWITDVSEDTATVDFNHELADERLDVELQVLDVR
ncbi:FKBP-type peptidyl-prolyl cis-trans isomerase [Halobacterium zhouii]|uniref:FKBP-type peptidyl-prolyl cis-trans isomerase n=1 Tax=Halobacterium zhouii TaxID=2902624 RepID=UPI001E290B8E|nr:FKBP-type peptidyl-prolyl cis-trans isomerase [Halobacterium zhouii]